MEAILIALLPNWSSITLYAHGRSRGCALGVNDKTTRMNNCWGLAGVLGMNVHFGQFELEFTLINVYGPCTNREDL